METPVLENDSGLLLLIFWIMWTFWSVFCLILFFRHRSSLYIQKRNPWLILMSALGSYFMMTSLTFKTVIGIGEDGFPNILEHWFIWFMIPLHFVPYPVRALHFIILYHVTLEENQPQGKGLAFWKWFNVHKRFRGDTAALLLAWFIIAIAITIGVVRNITVKDNWPDRPAPEFNGQLLYAMSLALTMFITALLWFAVYFVRKIGDELKYAGELTLIGVLWMICVSFYVICGMAKIRPAVLSSIAIIILVVATFLASFGMPIHLAFLKGSDTEFGSDVLSKVDVLMADDSGAELFLSFLRKSLCPEGYFFWRAVEAYQQIPLDDTALRKSRFTRIVEQYIGNDALSPINIPALMVKRIMDCRNDPTVDVFNDAFQENKKVLTTDQFRRFKVTKEAKKYMAELIRREYGILA